MMIGDFFFFFLNGFANVLLNRFVRPPGYTLLYVLARSSECENNENSTGSLNICEAVTNECLQL